MEAVRRVIDDEGHEAVQMSVESYYALELGVRFVVDHLHVLEQDEYEHFLATFEHMVKEKHGPEAAERILDILENFEAEAAITRDRKDDENDFIDWRDLKNQLNAQ